MDYKYIEQLIERYFQCETSLQEEQILRAFFAQNDVPEALGEYAPMFRGFEVEAELGLDESFDQKMLAMIGEAETESKVVKLNAQGGVHRNAVAQNNSQRSSVFAPFFRAAAIVACVLTIGGATETALTIDQETEGEPTTTINPYIRQADINQTIRIKDVNHAEYTTGADSVPRTLDSRP